MTDELNQTELENSVVEEPVLSDEEKEALLDGIESGDVEVHSTQGPRYAEVNEFIISPRCHIRTNSFPRLELLNSQMSTVLTKTGEKLLNVPFRVFPGNIAKVDFGSINEKTSGVAIVVNFKAEPLVGKALLYFPGDIVAQLVESFFGGSSSKPATQSSGLFTAGEKAVVQKFSEEVIRCMRTTWEKLSPLQTAHVGTHLSSDLIDGVDPSTEVISSTFFARIKESECEFHLLWPVEMIKSLMPALKDEKRDADPQKVALWTEQIRSVVTDSVVSISSQIGQTTMSLRDVAELREGDVFEIASPRNSTVFAKHVPLLKGLFGVHNGHYAIEATRWLVNNKHA